MKKLFCLLLALVMLLSSVPAIADDAEPVPAPAASVAGPGIPAEEEDDPAEIAAPAEEDDPVEIAAPAEEDDPVPFAPFVPGEYAQEPKWIPGQACIPGAGEQDADELFFAYMRSLLHETASPSKVWTAGESLTGSSRNIYAKLIEVIPKVAAGERSSTIFSSPGYDVFETCTAEDLGLSELYYMDEYGIPQMTNEAFELYRQRNDYDLLMILCALLSDFPFELYWYDKTVETLTEDCSFVLMYDASREDYVISPSGTFQVRFPVVEGYAASTYKVDPSVIDRVFAADRKAREIVEQYASRTDYEKLDGYRREICDLVSYNWEAAAQVIDGTYIYGDPWQLIWVFDGDPDTNVVCEGYAKAFQYLCDLSAFRSSLVRCISVTGIMDFNNSEGGHMWNVVRMENGKNYLVDITNCDAGTVGAPDRLFLCGAEMPGLNSFIRVRIENDEIYYYYDYMMDDVFSESDLMLESTEYQESTVEPTGSPSPSPTGSPAPSSSPTPKPSVSPSPSPSPSSDPEHYLAINEEIFPDAAFRTWIVQNLPVSGNADEGYYMTEAQVADVKQINCRGQRIAELSGIDRFSNLWSLNCSYNGIARLVIGNLPELHELDCSNNTMTSLELTGLPRLFSLNCSVNRLTALDTKELEFLRSLTCSFNEIEALDLSHNEFLVSISCSNNQLTALDVQNNAQLTYISIGQNQIDELDVRHCIELRTLYCNGNLLTTLDLGNCPINNLECDDNLLSTLILGPKESLLSLSCVRNQLRSLDVGDCPNLRYCRCCYNQLSELDFSGDTALEGIDCFNNALTLLNIDDCISLSYLTCYNNRLTSLNVDSCTGLQNLECHSNQLKELNLNNNSMLVTLNCSHNAIRRLDVSACTSMTDLTCRNNLLRSLDIGGNSAMRWLICDSNKLGYLNLGQQPNLVGLWCGYNCLEALDIGGCPMLRSLDCQYNRLRELDVSNHTELISAWCPYNRLVSLNTSNCPSLNDLSCSVNELTSIDIHSNTALTQLTCVYNRLTALDLHANTELTLLICHSNLLQALDVSHNTKLEVLWCEDNRIASLDVSSCPGLRGLQCDGNQLSRLDLSRNPELEIATFKNQTAPAYHGVQYDAGEYRFDMTQLMPKEMMDRITLSDDSLRMDLDSGCILFQQDCSRFQYQFDTGFTGFDATKMNVTVQMQDVPYLYLDSIPDANFRAWIIGNLPVQPLTETNGHQANSGLLQKTPAYFMSESQVLSVKEIDCSGAGIASMNGIQNFTGLERLNCSNNEIAALDLSQLGQLSQLDCSGNELTALNVSGNRSITRLNCAENSISELHVGENAYLIELNCADNNLSELSLNRNANLEVLDCSGNKLIELDVSNNPELTQLGCEGNQIQALDLGENEALRNKELEQTVSRQRGITRDGVYTFDLAALIGAANLDKVTLADAANTINAQGVVTFPGPVESFVYRYDTGNGVMTVTVPLTFEDAPVPFLEINETNFPDANFRAWIVENLPCIAEEGSVPFMTEEQVNSVTEIEIGGTFLTTAKGVELFPNLETLGVSGCGLTALDVTGIPSLVALFCNDTGSDEGDEELNQIAALDLSHNPLLEVLICDGNLLTELDLSHNPELVELNCGRNRITALDLSKNTKLRYLYCDENRLAVLDLSANDAIDEEYVTIVDQTLPQQVGKHANGTYIFDLAPIVGAANLANVRLNDAANTINAQGVVTFPGPVESFVYLYDTGHGLMDVTVPLTFEEVQPTAPSDVMSTAANFMGKMLVNYYIVMSEEALADKDAYVEIKLNDDVKKVLVRDADTDEKNGVLRHKFEMEVPSKCMRDDIVLKLHAGNGSLLPLTYKQETDVTEGFVYHMVDYLRGRQQNSTSETMRRLAYTAEWYGTACQLYFNHHVNQLTEAEIAAMNTALNDASIMTGLANYAPIEGGTLPNGITKRSNTVVFESDNTLRTYFYTANPNAYTFTMDDNEIHLNEWEAGKYNYDIPNIPGKELAKWHKVTATDGTNTYTYKTSALGYCYGRAANSSNVDMQNLAKTLYLYGKAAMAYFNVPDQPAPTDTPADPAAPNEPVLPESLQGRDIQLPIVP